MFQDPHYFDKMNLFDFHHTDGEEQAISITSKSKVTDEERYIVSSYFNDASDINALLYVIEKQDTDFKNRTIFIDSKLLSDEVINSLKDAYKRRIINGIRLLEDNSTLTKELFDKFNTPDFKYFIIAADNISDEIDNNNDLHILEQKNLCKIEHLKYGDKDHYNIHITKELSKEEIKELSGIINKNNYTNIFVDFYEPTYYKELLIELNKNNIPKDIEISLLANPLYDETSLYEDIEKLIDNPITINYNTCDDLNRYHMDEPYTEGANYYSDIEASGYATPETYNEMLKTIDEIVEHMEEKNYSPLEKLVYVHDYFKTHYIYDPDYLIRDHRVNSDLDKIYNSDRMVCEGFSNLYSAVLRRSGVLCFTYGTDDHQRNIVRIKDKKYKIDSLASIDPTWDLDDKNKYDFFLSPIDRFLYGDKNTEESQNVATSLFIDGQDYYDWINASNPGYVLDPLGYSIRMLNLMGLNCNEPELASSYETSNLYKNALHNSSLLTAVPNNVIIAAIDTVRKNENVSCDTNEIGIINESLKDRTIHYKENPTIKATIFGNPVPVEVKPFVPDTNMTFTEIEPQNLLLRRPRKQLDGESDIEYNEYLKKHYKTLFFDRKKDTEEEDKVEDNKTINPQANNNVDVETLPTSQDIINKMKIYHDLTQKKIEENITSKEAIKKIQEEYLENMRIFEAELELAKARENDDVIEQEVEEKEEVKPVNAVKKPIEITDKKVETKVETIEYTKVLTNRQIVDEYIKSLELEKQNNSHKKKSL